MKKFLLSLATVLCVGAFASADEVTYSHTFASNELKTTAGNVTLSNVIWTTTSSTYIGWDSKAGKGIQIGSANKPNKSYSLSTSGFAENTIKSITVNSSIASSGDATLTISVGNTAVINAKKLTTTATDYTASDLNLTGDITISWACTAKAYYVKSISITYATAEGVVVVTPPSFSIEPGTYPGTQTVELSADAGCTIYYTLDGQSPTDDTADGSTIKYVDPISITETTTIKAIAVDADDNFSSIVSATYNIVEVLEGATGSGTEDDPYNPIAAYNEGLMGSTAKVYVKGIVSEVVEFYPNYNSLSYYISEDGTTTNQFYIYSGLGLDGAAFTSTDDLKVGDVVVVYGQLTIYNNAPQINYNSIIIELNGSGAEPIVLEGDGTESNPFTVADVIAINPSESTSNEEYPDKYWVKGYIVGYSSSTSSKFTPIFNADAADTAANFILGPTADCTDENICIPVQLPSGSTVRTALNLIDNPSNLGKEVYVYGNIYKYFSLPGVKNVSDYKFVDTNIVEGIEIDNNAPVEYFNLQGVRVANPENGLYIMRQGDKVVKVIK